MTTLLVEYAAFQLQRIYQMAIFFHKLKSHHYVKLKSQSISKFFLLSNIAENERLARNGNALPCGGGGGGRKNWQFIERRARVCLLFNNLGWAKNRHLSRFVSLKRRSYLHNASHNWNIKHSNENNIVNNILCSKRIRRFIFLVLDTESWTARPHKPQPRFFFAVKSPQTHNLKLQ